MGLDMYLDRKVFIGNKYRKRKYKLTLEKKKEKEEEDTYTFLTKKVYIEDEKISYVTEQQIYWRKANAIHGWFVDNVQGGIDDCKSYQVTLEQLQELLNECKLTLEILENSVFNDTDGKYEIDPSELPLPPVSGFFFGSTDIDRYYKSDIEYTIKELERLLALPSDDNDFEYSSSW